ncbi:MAG: energy-coupling factor transporter transmembrane protein EcfT [Firmicutes bacterium]|nr:energy-coupling factor transporter transmembrane protein EcfT [Bacillota bacterium]
MFKDGLGENSTFAGCHPAVNLIFFLFAIGITMFSTSPAFLAVTLVFSWLYSILLNGKKAVKSNLIFTIPILIIMTVINTLFTHNGATVLFYLNNSRITLEALLYGLAAAVLLSSIIVWFSCFNVVMTSDKLIFIFGKAAPVLGLTLSMIFRFIPLLKARFREISMGQRCMGRHVAGGFLAKLRQVTKEVSILISWSLEAAIETSDSMEARGYGLHGRTSFHLFKMTPTDKALLTGISISGLIAASGCILGKTSIYYYPKVVLGQWDVLTVITFAAYVLMLAVPLITDIFGEIKWQQYRLEI